MSPFSILLSLFLLWCGGCAPLTLPKSQAPAPALSTADSVNAAEVSAVDQYLRRRQLRTDSTATARPYIAVLPFLDDSGFRQGVWDLPQEMARLLIAKMSAQPCWYPVPYEAVAQVVGKTRKLRLDQALRLGSQLKADFVLMGRLADYDMRRLSVGDPLLGGYKSYAGVAKIELRVLRTSDQTELGVQIADKEITDRGLGLDLLGKPRDQDLQFANLGKIKFGSEEFAATAIGQATIEAMDELVAKLSEMIKPSGLELNGEQAKILSVYSDEVYVNIGSENGLRSGYRLGVYPAVERASSDSLNALKRIGVVEVKEVIGARLSRVRVLEGKEWLRVGDRLELLTDEEPSGGQQQPGRPAQ